MIKVSIDFYSKLGLKDFVSIEEVKKVYRELVLVHHPDRGGDVRKMQEINNIYDILCKFKAQYDEWLNRIKYPQPVVVFRFSFGSVDNSVTTGVWYSATGNF